MGKVRCINANHGEISVRIVSDKVGARFPAVGKVDHNFARTMHDVAVVRIKPSGAMMNPEPLPPPEPLARDSMFTTEGATRSTAPTMVREYSSSKARSSLAGADDTGGCLCPAVSDATSISGRRLRLPLIIQ